MITDARTRIVLAMVITALVGATAHAQTIFTESFENPDIPEQWVISGFHADGPWPGWVGVNRYTGMLDTSINVPGSEKFINSFGDQIAYIFNNLPGEDTDASLTTTSDSLDATLAANTIYTLTFNTASDSGFSLNYHVELLAIDGSDVETVLGTAAGPVASLPFRRDHCRRRSMCLRISSRLLRASPRQRSGPAHGYQAMPIAGDAAWLPVFASPTFAPVGACVVGVCFSSLRTLSSSQNMTLLPALYVEPVHRLLLPA